jgi:hypothetical protein
MRITLTKQQALVAKCTDAKFWKPAGHVVRIGAGRIVSSDGYGMTRAPLDYDGEPVLVDAAIVSSLKRGGDIEVEGGKVRTFSVDGVAEYISGEQPEYPDVDETWAKLTKRKPKACIAMNPNLLKKMLSCMEKTDGWKQGPEAIVRLYVRRRRDPLEWRIEAEGKTIVEGLIMPMFVAWADEKAKEAAIGQ